MDKAHLLRLACAALADKERLIAQAAEAAHRAATHEESVPENDKDTRALESSYLAGAQAARARELKAVQNALSFVPLRDFSAQDAIGLTALVELESAGRTTAYFLLPYGGGLRLRVGGQEIVVVTPEAALGQALVGAHVGDELEVSGRAYEVVSLV
jgi:transcription elongation GreA/GreB family factor